MESILCLDEVIFRYDKKKEPLLAIKGFSVKPGERVGIIGANGSGKSTLVSLILGLCTPEHGKVLLFGKNVKWSDHYPLLGYIGDPSHRLGGLGLPTGIKVREIINIFKEVNCEELIQEHALLELEDKLEISKFYDRDANVLSDGERRRLMAFLALGKQAKLLIADEATQGLDDSSEEVVLDVVKEAANNRGLSVLWISHQRQELVLLTDRIYRLHNGDLQLLEEPVFRSDIEIKRKSGETKKYSDMTSRATLEILGKAFTDPLAFDFRVTGDCIGREDNHE